jgi:hypothetical protein
MQAGEKLEFIKPFHATQEVEVNPEIGDIDERDIFAGICNELISLYPENVRSKDVLDIDGFRTISEIPLQVAFQDGSYLHILVFRELDDIGPLSFGLTVTEHTDEGILLGGYFYEMSGKELTRSSLTPVPPSEDDPEEVDKTHYSVIHWVEAVDKLSMTEQSDDEDMRQMAIEVRAQLEESATFEQWEKDLGTDGLQPQAIEILRLVTLFESAQPYTPPSYDEGFTFD